MRKNTEQNNELPDYTGEISPRRTPLDVTFFLLVLLLTATGLVMLLSVSYPAAIQQFGKATYFFNRQFYFAAFGVGLMYVASRVDYHLLKRAAKPLLLFAMLLLVAVALKGFGDVNNNSRRWIDVGLFSFQPSEVAKIAVIIDFSAALAVREKQLSNFRKDLLPYLIKLGIFSVLLMLEPHLSGTVLILCTGAAVMFVGGLDKKWVLIGIGSAVLIVVLFLTGVIPYGQDRIAVWRDPFSDATGKGYQVVQGILAIGSGGLTGVGLGNSRQKQLYLPEVQNDYIFSVVCEELGLIGAALILALFALLIVRGYLIAMHAKDRFGCLLTVGIMTLFALQVFLNVSVVTGLLPNTGISLPFFSYGGTALIIEFAEMGIVLSVSRQCRYRVKPEKLTESRRSG